MVMTIRRKRKNKIKNKKNTNKIFCDNNDIAMLTRDQIYLHKPHRKMQMTSSYIKCISFFSSKQNINSAKTRTTKIQTKNN